MTRQSIAARRIEGRLSIVETTSHTSSAIADAMLAELGGPGYAALLVAMPEKLAYFGDGATIAALAQAVPGSYYGGALPARGFWGCACAGAEAATLRARVIALAAG